MASASYQSSKAALDTIMILIAVGCVIATQSCKEKPRYPIGTWCESESDCQADLSCYMSNQDHGFRIPQAYASDDDDDDQCLYRATCAAARKLQDVCPECVLFPPLICTTAWDGVGSPQYKMIEARRQRLESTCLKPRPEQTEPTSSDPKELLERKRTLQAWGSVPVTINGWNVHFPLSWQRDYAHYIERSRQLSRALRDLPEFRPACPEGIDLNNTITVTAGQCGGFRNGDLTKPPPKITLRRGIPYYRRGEPHNIM
jgi:hypothetical protein